MLVALKRRHVKILKARMRDLVYNEKLRERATFNSKADPTGTINATAGTSSASPTSFELPFAVKVGMDLERRLAAERGDFCYIVMGHAFSSRGIVPKSDDTITVSSKEYKIKKVRNGPGSAFYVFEIEDQ